VTGGISSVTGWVPVRFQAYLSRFRLIFYGNRADRAISGQEGNYLFDVVGGFVG
jgi:hypothetical protein